MLQARSVSFAYPARRGAATPVLDDVSLEIARGERVGLLGPNGSGKTTLLKLLAGMLKPDRGEIVIDGQPLATMSRRDVARRVAVVPQETHTTFDFSVIDMVLMGRYPHLGPFELEGAADLAIAREALAATGTGAFETRSYSTLSGGEKQRVVIAAALAQTPDLLLLDEPTAALDLGYQFEITGLLRRLNRERRTTMLISTHDLNIIAALCSHVILFRNGRVLAHGRTDDVLTASHIQALYDIEADVQFNERAGHLTVVPIARQH
jgi:iron complex transport system ATP-binding protein